MKDKSCVILMAYGSPEDALDIDRYLQDIFGDSPVPPGVRAENLKKYSLFGNRSPSNGILASLTKKLAISLEERGVDVFLAFKHWYPKIDEVAKRVRSENYSNVIGLPLFPLGSEGVYESYRQPLVVSLDGDPGIGVDVVNGFAGEQGYSELWTKRINGMSIAPSNDTVLFTAHSMPTGKYAENGYKEEFLRLAESLENRLEGVKCLRGFQSVGKHGSQWLTPSIESVILENSVTDSLVAVPIGFINDHLEVLYDLDLEFSLFLSQRGISYRRVPLLNDSDDFIHFLRKIVLKRIEGVSDS